MNISHAEEDQTARHRFESIFDRFHLDVFRYCVRRLARADAEDATAEVFATAWRRISSVPEGDQAKLWLIGVAYKVIGNQYRSRERWARLGTRLAGLRNEDLASTEGSPPEIVEALAKLSARDQELLRLICWDGLTNPEIAHVVGITENAVAQRAFRARARLKHQYELINGLSPQEELL